MSYDQNKMKQNNVSSWIFPILMLMFFPPLGVLLVVLKLLGGGKHTSGRHPYYAQKEGQAPVGARTTAGTAFVSPGSPHAARNLKAEQKPHNQMRKLAAKGKLLIPSAEFSPQYLPLPSRAA